MEKMEKGKGRKTNNKEEKITERKE